MGGEGAGAPARPLRAAGAPPVRLALMRHAKSSWRWDLPDRHRPLAKRGQRSARAVARRLEELGWAPDLIVASPALRSAETWVRMTEEGGAFRDAGIVFEDSFYGSHVFEASAAASIRAYLGGVRDGQRPANVLCLGHNPGWSLAVEAFTGKFVHLKTADVALLEGRSPEWPAALGASFSLVDVVRSRPLLAQ